MLGTVDVTIYIAVIGQLVSLLRIWAKTVAAVLAWMDCGINGMEDRRTPLKRLVFIPSISLPGRRNHSLRCARLSRLLRRLFRISLMDEPDEVACMMDRQGQNSRECSNCNTPLEF
jgi:transposase